MLGKSQRTVLLVGMLAYAAEAALRQHLTSPLIPPSKSDHSLTQFPGIAIKAVPRASIARTASARRAKYRFQHTENWTPIHASKVPVYGRPAAGTTTLGRAQRTPGGPGYENVSSTSALGFQYNVEVSLNGQSLLLGLDTGSADTWAVSSHVNCTNGLGGCRFGQPYTGTFTARPFPYEHMYIEYGDGESVQGPMGWMDVSVAGVRVENQTVGLADSALWMGNNITSGILGLAYPALTNAYVGPFSEHGEDYAFKYRPLFTSMVQEGLVDGWFSLVLDRGGSDGTLGLGGVPDHIQGVDYSTTAVTDIIIANVINKDYTAYDYSFYTIIPDGWVYGSESDQRKTPFVVDSGTSLIYAPSYIAEAINGAFDPPALYNYVAGGYYTACDATPPRVAIVIDGTNFYLNPEDLLVNTGFRNFDNMCLTTIADGGSGPYILGDVFLHNVVAVFDVGDAVMQFASRPRY